MTRLRSISEAVRRMDLVTGPSFSSLILTEQSVQGFKMFKLSHREFLWTDELHCVTLDGVEGGVGGVAGVGRRGGRQRHVGLAGLGDLHPPHSHQLHQLRGTVRHAVTVQTGIN